MIDHPEHVELTPGERVLLDDIERSLAALDPRLADRLTTHRCAGQRWHAARLPAGVAATVAGVAGMVACAIAGELGAGAVAAGLAAAGTVATTDDLADRDPVGLPSLRRRRPA